MPTPSGSDAPKSISGSDAAAQEVMPGVSSGEVRPLSAGSIQEPVKRRESSPPVKASPLPVPLRGASFSFKLRPVNASSGKNNRKTQLMQNIRTVALRASSGSREKSRCALKRKNPLVAERKNSSF
ncbi:hypothetical protein Theba_2423 [Mesotoga prima MesG1.Ag.4.2]|uniref:Uncharacterized protein n=1 Tax=Mesotoga prima MesG1.Ag.4.2 TaxID=660470 RepID=I2F7Y5_9BACT|nr:hypothetical protein [Mesotoga prima]AFK08038.1 hypothetical protein Theba_2423 [Mesotoga prima MesG1.Ag.4.2]HNQ71803.1 hypothetical protein [Mesotoga prima]HNS76795.1 hypothetical protein [Mesotoga prima]